MDTLPYFFFTKGNNFGDILVAFLDDINLVYSYRKEFAPRGAYSFLKELSPLRREAEMKMTELLALIIYHFT